MGNHAIRGGKLRPFTDKIGNDYPNAFWVVDDIDIRIGQSTIILVFVAYRDTGNYDLDRDPIPGASKTYVLTGADYWSAISEVSQYPPETPIAPILLAMAWQWAYSIKDDGPEGARISFFEDAVDPS